VREFAAELAAQLPRFPRVEIAFQDERLSSFAAEERLARTGRTHGEKKALRDALAACAILEDYLRVLRGESSGESSGAGDNAYNGSSDDACDDGVDDA
jgi:RNase H-fold protein (predicted Holliday junction resolvase)